MEVLELIGSIFYLFFSFFFPPLSVLDLYHIDLLDAIKTLVGRRKPVYIFLLNHAFTFAHSGAGRNDLMVLIEYDNSFCTWNDLLA